MSISTLNLGSLVSIWWQLLFFDVGYCPACGYSSKREDTCTLWFSFGSEVRQKEKRAYDILAKWIQLYNQFIIYFFGLQYPIWCRWLAYLPLTQDTWVRVPVSELFENAMGHWQDFTFLFLSLLVIDCTSLSFTALWRTLPLLEDIAFD